MYCKTLTHKLSILFFSLLFLAGCNPAQQEEKAYTKEDYQKAAKHLSSNMNKYVYNSISSSTWTENDQLYYGKTAKDGKAFILADPKSKEKMAAFDHTKLAASLSELLSETYEDTTLPFDMFEYTNDNKAIVFSIKESKYRCNLDDYTCEEISASSEDSMRAGRNEFASPDGKLAAYIDDYNLWVRNLETGKKTQLTFDGIKDYGYATNNAGWVKGDGPVLKWSPNSDKIATFQQDSRGVGEMYLVSTNVGHPKLEAWKHPLPGDSTVFRVERVIIHLGVKPNNGQATNETGLPKVHDHGSYRRKKRRII